MTTRTVILAPGSSAADTAPILVEADQLVSVGIYSDAPASLHMGVQFQVLRVTPGAPNTIAWLTNANRDTQLYGPGEYVVRRPASDDAPFGVFVEVADA